MWIIKDAIRRSETILWDGVQEIKRQEYKPYVTQKPMRRQCPTSTLVCLFNLAAWDATPGAETQRLKPGLQSSAESRALSWAHLRVCSPLCRTSTSNAAKAELLKSSRTQITSITIFSFYCHLASASGAWWQKLRDWGGASPPKPPPP